MKNVYIVIPSLDPDTKIMEKFINELKKECPNILVINDGSKSEYKEFFKKLEKSGIEVFEHHKNLGKGRALKNAFNYLLNEKKNLVGVVTCDCDGQHGVKDIKKIAQMISLDKDELILGTRDFDASNVPLKSMLGNKITRMIFKNFVGIKITDTQTGLRGLNANLMNMFIDSIGERYEYETTMLIDCKNKGIPINEIIIETIYIDNNSNSHFNPIKDGMRIYKLFANYFIGSIAKFIINIILFMLLINILNNNILLTTFIAGTLTYLIYHFIHTNKIINGVNLIKYYLIIIVELLLSGLLVMLLDKIIPLLVAKIIIDLLLESGFLFIKNKINFGE